MLSTTTMTLRQSRRNSSTISPVRHGAEQALDADAPHGPGDVGRLVELEADLDVRRAAPSCMRRQVRLHLVDHRQRRGVGPLGDQDVDGAAGR